VGPEPGPGAGFASRTRIHVQRDPIAAGLVLLAVAAFVVGMISRSEAEIGLAVTIVAAVALDLWFARRAVASARIVLHGPPDAVADEPTQWVLTVDGLRRPITISPSLMPRTPRFDVDHGEPALLTLPPLGRGLLLHVALDITAAGPIGLYRAGRRELVSLTSPVPIGPRPVDFDITWPTPRAVAFGLAEGAPLGDDLFRSIRPYVRGDEPRRVHWRSTAHHGRLMVRECDGTGVVAVQVVLDTGMPGPLAEAVVEAAGAVCRGALGRGWLVHLVTIEAPRSGGAAPRLGSPFGPALNPQPEPVLDPEVRVRRIRTERDVNRQLAAAAFGRPVPPRFGGMTCTVTQEGIRWS
jgi:uncharacterized protein (DUF58 family)